MRAKSPGFEARLAGIIGYEPLVAGAVFARHHHCFAHAGMLPQPCLDLAELNAKAPDLDLEVVAAKIFDSAIRTPAAQIARPVHPRIRLLGERVPQKPLRRQLGPVQVASGHARAANVNLSRNPDGRRLQICVQNVDLRVGNRAADWRRMARGEVFGRVKDRAADHGLSGTIFIHHANIRLDSAAKAERSMPAALHPLRRIIQRRFVLLLEERVAQAHRDVPE